MTASVVGVEQVFYCSTLVAMTGQSARAARTRVVALVLVVALVGLSAATVLGILLSGDDDAGTTPAEPVQGAGARVTLVLPDAPAGRCAAFSVDVLRGAEQAFAGTAVRVDDREVVLRVEHWYRGGDAGEVRLVTGDQQARALIEGLELSEGGRYLVAASGGVVVPCGFSAPWSEATARAYAEAFEG
jgi:hypothetical protein